jgi:uncharacterized membrane protein YqaE (UPF0057 family)
MKKFRLIIAALLTLGFVQGVWAIAPGGALGGGGKSAQAHPAQESNPVVEPVQTAHAATLEEQVGMENSAESAITLQTNRTQDVVIGKGGTEGQSNQEVDNADFNEVVADHNAKKEARRNFKEMVKQLRAHKSGDAPESPLSDTMLVLCVILCFLIPPLAVYLYFGTIGTEFWISLVLSLLFFFPGVIYSLIVILMK